MTSLNPHPEVVDGVDVDAVAAAVRSCPGVEDLDAGPLGSVVSYLPGRQVAGVHVGEQRVTVQVRSRWGVPVPDVGHQVQSAVRPLVAGRPVDVVVAAVGDPAGAAVPAIGADNGTAWTSGKPGSEHAAPTSGTITPTGAGIPPSS